VNKQWSGKRQHLPATRTPNFDSGVIAEPLLAFGGNHSHVDPKVGLGLYGPYTLVGQERPSLSNIIVGMVGTSYTTANTEQWIKACEQVLMNDGSQPFLYPYFPGFNSGHPFRCQLTYGDTWRDCIKSDNIKDATGVPNFFDRIKKVTSLYLRSIETLAQRDPRPDVILCCLPQEVIDFCTVRKTRYGEGKRIKRTKSEKLYQRIAKTGQAFLFPDMNPTLGIEDEESGHENLRRGLKAEAMQFGIPTQLVWPRTTQIVNDGSLTGETSVQDVATRAWNFMTALYHKAGGTPWRLAEVEPGTCFVGISFYREKIQEYAHMRTAMAQTFTASGDGYVIRGDSFEWEEGRLGNSPHLDNKSAAALMREVISLYQRQNRGALPSRLVLHKSSKFWDEELRGFKDACEPIPRKDFVAIGKRGVQFYRTGEYPPLRGTFIKFNDTDLLLYTIGYIPFLRTYPGARVPQPLEILEHYSDSPWNVVLQDIQAMTKMNWNTADFACSEPITIAFSQRVGQILAELPSHLPLRNEYRFYM
jgi:hypothetical protein